MPATVQLEECIRTFPMRRTAAGVTGTSPKDLMQMVLHMVNNSSTAMNEKLQKNETPVLALLDGKVTDSQPDSLELHQDSQQSELEEAKTEAAVHKAELKNNVLKPPVGKKKEKSISEVLASLKVAYTQDNKERKEKKQAEVEQAAVAEVKTGGEQPEKKRKQKPSVGEEEEKAPLEPAKKKKKEPVAVKKVEKETKKAEIPTREKKKNWH